MNDPLLNKHAAKTILDKYMWSCPTLDLEKKVFSIVCPFLKTSIFEIVEEIEKQLDNPEFVKNIEATTFDGQYIEIKNLLARWHGILRHAAQIEKTFATVESVLKYLPSIVIKICEHCKCSRTKYLKRSLPLLLQDIYRDTCSIVKNYCALFFKEFRVNGSKNSDMDALKQVITGLGDMAPHTAYGMSTMIHTWKTFKYLACLKTSTLLKRKDCVDRIRGYLKVIGQNINKLYKQIMMRPESEFVTRAKCANILLEIFIQLHQAFGEDVSTFPFEQDFFHDMIPVLIEFVGYYELCRGWNFDSSKSSKRDQIIVECWPKKLLSYYEKSSHYLPEFRLQAKEIQSKNDPDFALGFHYCLVHYEVFDKPERLDMALGNINYLQVEIMEQSTRWPDWGTAIGGMIEAGIYEYSLSLLCQTCNFTHDNESFGNYEDILLKHLFSERFWSSLLAYDILIYCYICSDKKLALTHIHYFMMAYETLQKRQYDSLAVTMLCRIMQDIYELLPASEVQKLLDVCQSPASLLVIMKSNPKHGLHKNLVARYRKLSFSLLPNSLSEAMSDLEERPTTQNWIRFVNQLTVMEVERKQYNNKLTENLLDITSFAWRTVGELEDVHLQGILYELILILFDCTRVHDETRGSYSFNWNLFKALAEKLLRTTDIPECVLIKVCYYLTRNEDCLAGPYDGNEKTIIPAMFIRLLESESQLVHLEALECFDRISEKSNENLIKLITNAIAKRPKLSANVRAYLERDTHPISHDGHTMPPGWQSYAKISSHFNDFAVTHQCQYNEIRMRGVKLPKLCEESLAERINRLTDELTALSRHDINLVPDGAAKLKAVCRSILER